MTKIYEWKPGISQEEMKDGAYWERNMLALHFADGWYNDTDNNWEGWKRVLSLCNGAMCFHIPDEFDVGNLPQIEPNWNGHTTREKWLMVLKKRGLK